MKQALSTLMLALLAATAPLAAPGDAPPPPSTVDTSGRLWGVPGLAMSGTMWCPVRGVCADEFPRLFAADL